MNREVCHEKIVVFFFQAEDGIRDYKVTGVQTCALPIYYEHMLSLIDLDILSLCKIVLCSNLYV